MKIIKISTELELSMHEFPEGTYEQQNEALRELIGNSCNTYEHVMPRRLYTVLEMVDYTTEVSGECVSMLVDEDGLSKEIKSNAIGNFLYETDVHGHPIMGNILLVGEELGDDGIGFCGIDESVFKLLKQRLDSLILGMKVEKGA